jgi:hypothetical protein
MLMTKESHSSCCTTFAIRLDTSSSRIDIRFIKPQALLALSIVICAWRLVKVKRFSRSKILEEYSVHWQQRREGDETLESKAPAEEGAWSRLEGSPIRIDWKPKERREAFQKLTRYIIEKKHIYIDANPLTQVLGLHMTKGFYIKSRNGKLQQEDRVYATSAFRSMAEEGMAKSAPAVEGGAGSAVARVEEVDIKEAAEAAEGEIIDTMAGGNFFAFLKKAFSSEWVRP